MTNHLGTFFRTARLAKGLTLEGLAHLTGFGNTKKIASRIACFEAGGTISDELLSRLGDALDIDFPTVDGLLAQDRPEAIHLIQRQYDGCYLTPAYLQWSASLEDAQRCVQDEALAIQDWLEGIGIKVTVISLTKAHVSNFV